MGRKSTEKSKLKKLKRKEESAKLAQKLAHVNTANLQDDPMKTLLPFKKFERNGLKLIINCWRVMNLEEKLIDWAFQLTKTNMMRLYENSEWGWSDKLKKEEMTHDNSWFLVAMDASLVTIDTVSKGTSLKTVKDNVLIQTTLKDSISSNNDDVSKLINSKSSSETNNCGKILNPKDINIGATFSDDNNTNLNASNSITSKINQMSINSHDLTEQKNCSKISEFLVKDMKPVAMAHFRFDLENEEEVLYCYEIQLSPEVRRKGLGKFMMQILELIAFKSDMKKVMLTTFKKNRSAQEFFNRLKYTVDETSPEEDEDGEPCSYEIYSKAIGQKVSAGNHNGHAHVHNGCCRH